MNDTVLRGRVLVVLQMVLLGIMLWRTGSTWWSKDGSLLSRVSLACAMALGLWAVLSMHRHSLTATPVPTERNQLTSRGPYRWIRHPMYAALLLLCVAVLLARPDGYSLILSGLLMGILWNKIELEERLLSERHPGYASYRARTWRLIPGIY